MDGYDENGNNSADAADSTRQAIFTPEAVTPPTDQALNQPVTTGSVVEPATIRLSHPSMPNETGDIVLRTEGGKFNKKWLVVVAIALVVLAVLLVVVSNLTRTTGSKRIAKLFEEYEQIVVDGPDDATEETIAIDIEEAQAGDENKNEYEGITAEDDWFIFDGAGALVPLERIEYVNNLQEKYDTFQKAVLEYVDTLGTAEEISEVKDTLESYSDLLAYVTYMLNVSDMEEELQNIYLNNGLQPAQSYIGEKTIPSDDELLSVAYNSVSEFLTARINTLSFYAQNNCIDTTDIDEACISLLYDSDNPEYLALIDDETISYEELDANFETIKTLFYGMTRNIKSLAEDIDA